MKVVLTSGCFALIHRGHVNHLREARKLGDYLIVHVHRDECTLRHKRYNVLSLEDKVAILKAFPFVDEIWPCEEPCDGTAFRALLRLRERYPNEELIFARGGDRTPSTMPLHVLSACKELGIRIVYEVGGGKVESSSSIVQRLLKSLYSQSH